MVDISFYCCPCLSHSHLFHCRQDDWSEAFRGRLSFCVMVQSVSLVVCYILLTNYYPPQVMGYSNASTSIVLLSVFVDLAVVFLLTCTSWRWLGNLYLHHSGCARFSLCFGRVVWMVVFILFQLAGYIMVCARLYVMNEQFTLLVIGVIALPPLFYGYVLLIISLTMLHYQDRLARSLQLLGDPVIVAGVPTPMLSNQAALTGKRTSHKNRWGDGIDAPKAGARNFFPTGWVVDTDIRGALSLFQLSSQYIVALEDGAETKVKRLISMGGMKLAVKHATAVIAYTADNEDLYPVLTRAMRTSGAVAEKKLDLFRPFIYFLGCALQSLPTFEGKVYRGLKDRLSPSLYSPGSNITWQQFSSASKLVMVTLGFLTVNGAAISGTLFVITSSVGKEIEELSQFPDEEEVLFTYNSMFKVVSKLSSDADKRAEVPQFDAYDLDNLELYVLEQLG